jgi:hypothetical protein
MIWPFLATLWLSPLADVPSTQAIQAAIQSLAPRRVPAKKYARIIHREARRRNIDPFLIVAIIHVESSWNSRARSPTNDWGLTQSHVSNTINTEFIGREELLFDPDVNIRVGVKTLALWKAWHERVCDRTNKANEPRVVHNNHRDVPLLTINRNLKTAQVHSQEHPFWSHYQWGYRVRNLGWSRKVNVLYQTLRRRFATPPSLAWR